MTTYMEMPDAKIIYFLFGYWGATSPHLIGYQPTCDLLINSLMMWGIGSTLNATIHYSIFRASSANKLRQLNMVFSMLHILSRVTRMRLTASMTFGQKNICGQLEIFASFLEFFDVARCTKWHNGVKISTLTEKKLRSQIAGIDGSVYVLTRLVHATSSCCKWLRQRKLPSVFFSFRSAVCHCASPISCFLVIFLW